MAVREIEYHLQTETSTAEPVAERVPWLTFLFLLLVFAFATPYELDSSLRDNSLDEMVENVAEGTLGRRLAMPVLGAYGLLLLVSRRSRRLRINGLLGLTFGCFLALAFVSLFWAEDFAIVARKLTVFGLLILAATGMAARFTLREIMLFVCLVCCSVMLLGLGAELALGTFLRASEYSLYQFGGVMQSNATAAYCGIGIIAAFALANLEPRWRKLYLGLSAAGFGFLLLTKSRTAFGSTIAVLFLYWVATTDLKRKVTAFLCAGTICCALGLVYSDDLSTGLTNTLLLGRAQEGTADSLGNRLPLWQECLDYVARRPLLGYGFDSFWTPQRIYTISKNQGWEVPHSHNGYLEMTLSLGVIGLSIYMLMLMLYLKTAFKTWLISRNPACLYAFVIVVWLCLEMIMEKVYMSPIFPSFLCNLLIARFAFVQAEEQQPLFNDRQFDPSELPLSRQQ